MKKVLKIIGLLVALIGVNGLLIGLFFLQGSVQNTTSQNSASGSIFPSPENKMYFSTLEQKNIGITQGDKSDYLIVHLAKTPEQHYRGLSGSTPLAKNEGMLFLYPDGIKQPRFVMRDMNYPLDISFFDQSGNLISSHRNLSPCTPELCTPVGPEVETPVHYVLETIPRGEDVQKIEVK